MIKLDIAHQRLHNQSIVETSFEKPGEIVHWLGAVQAQDYAAAKWALALRLQDATDADIEQAFADGTILRTHLMRPTWHFISPSDIRWLLALTASRVKMACAYQWRKLELDDALFIRSNASLEKALQGGKQLTRSELASVFQRAGIEANDEGRLSHIMMRAELDGIVCSGARRGKQFTYALLEERVPPTRILDHDEALADFVSRYFTSHGPATLHDFVWWSGLTVADARAGLEMVKSQLVQEVVEGQLYWRALSPPLERDLSHIACLLPNYDEYIVGYKDRSAIFDLSHTKQLDSRGNVLFTHTIVLDGRIVGIWKRTLKKNSVTITPTLFTPLNELELAALDTATSRYRVYAC